MNKYEELYKTSRKDLNDANISSALDATSNWEDKYWLSRIIMEGDSHISDEVVIDNLEYCLFAGLSLAQKEIFYDANERLAKLYIRYGQYNEAQSKLIVLVNNFDCPDWVHLYFAMTQLHTMFERIVEEPKFFFERLLSTKSDSIETKQEVRNIFGKFLCSIVEQTPDCDIAINEIVRFAERINYTQSDEFKLFHKEICPNLAYSSVPDESEVLAKALASEMEAKIKAVELEEKLAEARKTEAEYKRQLQEHKEAEVIHCKNIDAKDSSIARLKSEIEAEQSKARKAEEEYLRQLQDQKAQAEKIKQEKSILTKRLHELEQAKKTELEPQSIDDVYQQITTWLNCRLRRYLAQWLTKHFEQNNRTDYWNKKVKPALQPQELKKFDSYKELTDFAFDAILNIYYYNFNDFYPYGSWAKTNDKERLQEMQQIRNRWVGHFEENRWTKEKILFDIDTIIEFLSQIEMPRDRQKEYIEFRTAVVKMQ